MGLASALNAPQMGLRWAPPPGGDRVLLGRRPAHLALPPRLPSRSASTLVFSRRRNRNSIVTSSPKKNKNKLQRLGGNGAVAAEEEEEIDEDAFEALFRQLEEDLKKDDPSLFDGDDDDDDEEISEEDLAKLDEQLAEVFDMTGYDDESEDDVVVEIEEEEEEEEEEDEEEEQPLTLKNWQLRRLASALKIGRRKANIKNLAAELCLDRAIVLELLRNSPPNLLMMSAALPDHEPSPTITITEVKTIETEVKTVETVMETTATPKPDTAEKVPVHVMQQRFSNQKRLKKAHLQTLEDVYRRTKRPTNAMIGSIVHVTNLPRKRIVKWFEDKRSEEGVPEQRIPYQRSVPDSVQ